jgi:phosphonate transport system substrate-binding protein
MRRRQFVTALLVGVSIGSLGVTSAMAEYRLAMTPRFAPEVIIERIDPLRERLAEQLNASVELVMTKDFADYVRVVNGGEIDIAYSNPTHYAQTREAVEVAAIKTAPGVGPRMRGLIITRADGYVVSIDELAGRSAVIVGYTSVGGYLSQKVYLEEQGIDISTMELQEARGNKQENVVLSVYYGSVDVGFLREDALNIADRYVPPSQIRVINRTTWMPNWAMTVRRDLPAKVKRTVRETLLELKPDDPILEALQVHRFVEGDDSDYDVIRRALDMPNAPREGR